MSLKRTRHPGSWTNDFSNKRSLQQRHASEMLEQVTLLEQELPSHARPALKRLGAFYLGDLCATERQLSAAIKYWWLTAPRMPPLLAFRAVIQIAVYQLRIFWSIVRGKYLAGVLS
jgi:hypothetical protein